jgi:DNA polymerase-3 subunit beta
MKFVISTQELNYLITKCQNVVSQKSTMPILANLMIEARNGEIVVTATDLTVGIRCITEAKILEEGVTTLPAKKFASLIRELTAINVEVTTDESEVTELIADASRFKLNGMSAATFPSLPDLAGSIPLKLSQANLKEMFFSTAFAVSREDSRFALTGVFLHIENGKVVFVGTDGKRLAKNELPFEIDASISGRYIIPLKAVEEILKNLEDEGDVTLHLTSDKIAIETENTILITKLLSGDYPDYNRVIPDSSGASVALHREELMHLLRQVSLFTPSEGIQSSVRFTFVSGEVKLNANAAEVGEGKVSMPVNYHGPQLDIAFNPHFFLDILRHTKGETVNIALTDSFNPGVITDTLPPSEEEQEKKSTSLFVLMPMRLSE